jgi:hypothetical protein
VREPESARQTADVVQGLTHQSEVIPDFVQDARWKAIVSVACAATVKEAIAFCTQAVSFLQEGLKNLHEFILSALSFLTKMMEMDDPAFDIILKAQVPHCAMNLAFQFQNSTLLHNEVLRFVQVGLQNAEFASVIVMCYVPVAVDRGANDTNRTVRSLCLEVMQLIFAAADKNKKLAAMLTIGLNGVMAFKKGPLKEFTTLLTQPYGGRLPVAEPPWLANFFKV